MDIPLLLEVICPMRETRNNTVKLDLRYWDRKELDDFGVGWREGKYYYNPIWFKYYDVEPYPDPSDTSLIAAVKRYLRWKRNLELEGK